MFRQIYSLLALILISLTVYGQELRPYNPTQETNITMISLGTSLTLGSMYLDRKVKPLSLEQLEAIDYDRILPIDRYSTRHLSFPTDEFTDKLLLTSFASPFFLMLDKDGRNNFDDMAMVVFQGALINSALINLSKVVAKRPRPYNYNPDAPLDMKMKKSSRYSFYSGHVATAAYFSFTTAVLYSDLNPDSKAKPLIWTAAALIPTAVAYGRMRAGKHFFTDVLTGFVAGSAIAIIVPTLHR